METETCRAALRKFPRAPLVHTPTPLHKLARLSAQFPPHNLFIKRDDCTGLAFGGNKTRHLEFYLGDALARGCDTMLGSGAVQSNHIRMLAAASAQFGLECHALLEQPAPDTPPDLKRAGNAFLNTLFGAKVHYHARAAEYTPAANDDADNAAADRALADLAARLRQRGSNPYLIHARKTHATRGALGYVAAAVELAMQLQQQNIHIDLIAVASGSGATHAGLLIGLRWLRLPIPVVGVCVRRDAAAQRARVWCIAQNLADMCGAPPPARDDVWTEDATLAPGYGKTSARVFADMRMFARAQGILTDPTYSGKTISYILQGLHTRALRYRNILLIHTGGLPALFAMPNMVL